MSKIKKINILFVCLGNICRSPAAEGIFIHFAKELGLQHYFEVDSAGTGNWHVGNQPDLRMQSAANKRGIYLTSLARKLRKEDFSYFDLILTMDDSNYALTQKLALDSKCEIKASIKPILSYRKNFNVKQVPDPYFGGDQGFEYVLDLLEDSCKSLLEELSLSLKE